MKSFNNTLLNSLRTMPPITVNHKYHKVAMWIDKMAKVHQNQNNTMRLLQN